MRDSFWTILPIFAIIFVFFLGMQSHRFLTESSVSECDSLVLSLTNEDVYKYYGTNDIFIPHYYAYYSMRHNKCLLEK